MKFYQIIFVIFFQELAKKVYQNAKDIQVKKEKHQVLFFNLRNNIIRYNYFLNLYLGLGRTSEKN